MWPRAKPLEMIMDRHAVHYRRHVIIPLASVGTRGYAASVFVTGPNGRRKAFGILGYFSSEEEAIEYATSCAKARIEGNRMPGLPRKLVGAGGPPPGLLWWARPPRLRDGGNRQRAGARLIA